MNIWDWEYFTELQFENVRLDAGHTDAIALHSALLLRDEDRRIELTTQSADAIGKITPQRAMGETYIDNSYSKLFTPNYTIELLGIGQKKIKENLISEGIDKFTTTFDIQHVKLLVNSMEDSGVVKIIDYVANLPVNQYIWPNGYVENIDDETPNRTYFGFEEVSVRCAVKEWCVNRSSMMLSIGGYTIIVGRFDSNSAPQPGAGYILYVGNPNEDERSRIRQSMSFAFGCPLVYFSSIGLNAQDHVVYGQLKAAQSSNGAFFKIPSIPPAPITVENSNMLDATAFQRIAQGIYNFKNQCDLDSLLWKMQYSEIAPYFMKPAYYGSLIERLQENYIELHGADLGRTLVPKKYFRYFKQPVLRYLDKLKLPLDLHGEFSNRINNANLAPRRVITERFFNLLGLELGEIENQAWKNRNDAAHGNVIEIEEQPLFIRRTRILKIILNRIILKITNGSDSYIDYFTLNYAIRDLEHSISVIDECSNKSEISKETKGNYK